MTSYFYYKMLAELTWKRHNTIKQYFNRTRQDVKNPVNFRDYLNKYYLRDYKNEDSI